VLDENMDETPVLIAHIQEHKGIATSFKKKMNNFFAQIFLCYFFLLRKKNEETCQEKLIELIKEFPDLNDEKFDLDYCWYHCRHLGVS
jgi:hypothetical protein